MGEFEANSARFFKALLRSSIKLNGYCNEVFNNAYPRIKYNQDNASAQSRQSSAKRWGQAPARVTLIFFDEYGRHEHVKPKRWEIPA